jgi:hypothetical protein
MSSRLEYSETAILARALDPKASVMTPEAARYFLHIDFRPEDIDRMNALAEKSRQGVLSENERQEMENYCSVGDFLGILRAKARMVLKKY